MIYKTFLTWKIFVLKNKPKKLRDEPSIPLIYMQEFLQITCEYVRKAFSKRAFSAKGQGEKVVALESKFRNG